MLFYGAMHLSNGSRQIWFCLFYSLSMFIQYSLLSGRLAPLVLHPESPSPVKVRKQLPIPKLNFMKKYWLSHLANSYIYHPSLLFRIATWPIWFCTFNFPHDHKKCNGEVIFYGFWALISSSIMFSYNQTVSCNFYNIMVGFKYVSISIFTNGHPGTNFSLVPTILPLSFPQYKSNTA